MLEFQTDPVGVGLFLCTGKQLFSFATINLHRCWPCEWKRSIMTDYVTGRDEVNLQSILIGSWTDEMGLSHLLGTASFVPQENINLLTVCWSMTWWLNIFVLMDFDTKHTDNKIWPILRISEILTKTKKRAKQSRVEELESRQRSCTRQKALVRQHGGLRAYWCDETWWWWPNKLDQ